MAEGINLIKEAIPNQKAAAEVVSRLHDAARPEAVFSKPLQAGEYTVITAAESGIGLGFGYGGGGGGDAEAGEKQEDGTPVPAGLGMGGGGGGGGAAWSRPVAAIEIGPHGVRVEPIVDPTKIALAFFTTLVSMFAMMGQMRRMRMRMQQGPGRK